METITWFEYSQEKSDINNVITFLEFLPAKFKMFVDPHNSTFKEYLTKYDNYGVNSSLFDQTLIDATTEYNLRFLQLKRRLQLDQLWGNRVRNDRFGEALRRSGLTGSSLRFKVNTLKLLWGKVIDKVQEFPQRIIDFANNDIVKLLRKFFAYLNSILGSFLTVFPGIEGIKEVKEIIEAYLSIADN